MTQTTAAVATSWQIDSAHSSASFSVRHMMISTVKGQFGTVSGTIQAEQGNPTGGSVEAVIDVSTIHTRDENRDNHLRSPDFFDVATYPTITFTSKRVEQKDEETYKITGDLTMHGVTKEVTLDTVLRG